MLSLIKATYNNRCGGVGICELVHSILRKNRLKHPLLHKNPITMGVVIILLHAGYPMMD